DSAIRRGFTREREQVVVPSGERGFDSDERRAGRSRFDGQCLGTQGVAGARERRARARDRAHGGRAGGRVSRAVAAGCRCCSDACIRANRVAATRRRPSARSRHRVGCHGDPRRLDARSGRGGDRRTCMSATRSIDAVVEGLCGDLSRIRAPRGTELNARSWSTEAPLRMLLNNLDRDVAERPEELIVYGGSGKAARNPEALRAIVRWLLELGDEERLPLQGTYQTFAAAGERHFGSSDLHGRTILTAGLGGMGGAQPLAATMTGAAILCVEVDPARIERRLATRYLDESTDSVDDALARVR